MTFIEMKDDSYPEFLWEILQQIKAARNIALTVKEEYREEIRLEKIKKKIDSQVIGYMRDK